MSDLHKDILDIIEEVEQDQLSQRRDALMQGHFDESYASMVDSSEQVIVDKLIEAEDKLDQARKLARHGIDFMNCTLKVHVLIATGDGKSETMQRLHKEREGLTRAMQKMEPEVLA